MTTTRAQVGKCGTCEYFKPTDPAGGECHNAPPILQGSGSVWPHCNWDDWCGQYQQITVTPPAGSGAVYELDSSTDPPGPGGVRFTTGDQVNPGSLWIAKTDANGDDQTAALDTIANGSTITLTDETDTTAWQQYVAVAPVVDYGDFVAIGNVVHYNQGGLLTLPCRVVITLGAMR